MDVLGLLLGNLAVAATYSAALIGAGYGLDSILQRRLGCEGCGGRIDWGTAFCLGLGIYGSLWIILGLGGWLRLPAVIAALAPGWLFCIYRVVHAIRIASHSTRRTWGRAGIGELGISGCILVLMLFTVMYHLVPAAAIEPNGDALAFYLAWPKVIASSGIIRPLVGYEAFSGFWMLSEIHLAAIMIFGGDLAARYFPLLSLLAAAGVLWELASTCGSKLQGKLLAAVVLTTSMAAINVSVDGKTDMIAVAPGLAAVLWALRLHSERTGRALVYTGACCGTAIAAKLSYIPPLGAAILLLILLQASAGQPGFRRSLTYFVKWGSAIGLVALLVTIPNLLKNFTLFGDPFIPFSSGGLRDVWFSHAVQVRILLTLPFALTFGQYWAQHGGISPLIVGLLPLLMLWFPDRSQSGRNLRSVGLAAAIALAVWMLIAPSQIAPRYFLAPLLLFGIVAAWAGEQAWQRGALGLRVGVPLFAAAATASIAWEVSHKGARARNFEIPVYLQGSPTNCSPQGGANCQIAVFVNANLKPGERIMLFSYFRYFFRADLLQCLVAPASGLTEQNMRERGADYVIVDSQNWSWPKGVPTPSSTLAELLHSVGPYALYRLMPAPGGEGSKHPCVMTAPGRWSPAV